MPSRIPSMSDVVMMVDGRECYKITLNHLTVGWIDSTSSIVRTRTPLYKFVTVHGRVVAEDMETLELAKGFAMGWALGQKHRDIEQGRV